MSLIVGIISLNWTGSVSTVTALFYDFNFTQMQTESLKIVLISEIKKYAVLYPLIFICMS